MDGMAETPQCDLQRSALSHIQQGPVIFRGYVYRLFNFVNKIPFRTRLVCYTAVFSVVT